MKLRSKIRIFRSAAISILAALVLVSVITPLQPVGKFISGAGNLMLVTQASGGNYDKYDVITNIAPGADVRDVARRHNLPIVRNLGDNVYLFRLQTSDSRTVEQVVVELKADRSVAWAEPHYFAKLPELDGTDQRSSPYIDQRSSGYIDGVSPSDYFVQYAVSLIKADLARPIANNGLGVTVAIVDTGVDTNHPVFHNVAPGYDYLGDGPNPAEEGSGPAYGHGTMVAGIVALVAPEATIMPLRAFDSNGSAKIVDITASINYAVDHDAQVLNLSFGLLTDSQLLSKTISNALSRGVVVIASAGNNNSSSPQYPAAYPGVLAVGASDQYDAKASFSNYGAFVGVAAPGVNIYSAYPNNQWAWWDGTSFSAPFVSGEAALRLSHGGGDVVQVIKNTAVPCCGGLLGRGRIDALAAVRQ
ncbi:MAG: S8 family serine peptidase [Acidobacteria bacterium]|nr:S8 family serine peptidase [Acidobacteriota bacterium]